MIATNKVAEMWKALIEEYFSLDHYSENQENLRLETTMLLWVIKIVLDQQQQKYAFVCASLLITHAKAKTDVVQYE